MALPQIPPARRQQRLHVADGHSRTVHAVLWNQWRGLSDVDTAPNGRSKMNQAVTTVDIGKIMESVMIGGDLEALTPEQRTEYYLNVCRSVGLNPATQPFEYIKLQGKLKLYARKDCTDQLRYLHNVSVVEMTRADRDGLFIVTAKVANAAGRTDMSTGAVSIKGLQGDALANALMKAETKAKRRATLSICGLGFLDETEVEDIPAPARQHVRLPTSHAVTPAEDAAGSSVPPQDGTDEPFYSRPIVDRVTLGHLEDLENAAMTGTAAMAEEWKRITPHHQHLLKSEKERLKTIAKDADLNRARAKP